MNLVQECKWYKMSEIKRTKMVKGLHLEDLLHLQDNCLEKMDLLHLVVNLEVEINMKVYSDFNMKKKTFRI